MREELIEKVKQIVKVTLEKDGSGHDWWHILRVWKLAREIGQKENADLFVVELGALLHDIADYKLHGGDELIGGKTAAKILRDLEVSNEIIEQVVYIVDNISFKGQKEKQLDTLEAKIVFDADKLDSIGAIGIARCFAYGGHTGTPIYDPTVKHNPNISKEEYIKKSLGQEKTSSINHFYEKLLLIKNLMFSETGKKLAQKRHAFLENFLEEFYAEWDGGEMN